MDFFFLGGGGGVGSLQNWTIFGSFLYIVGLKLKVKVQNGNKLGSLKFRIFFVICLNS